MRKVRVIKNNRGVKYDEVCVEFEHGKTFREVFFLANFKSFSGYEFWVNGQNYGGVVGKSVDEILDKVVDEQIVEININYYLKGN